MVVLALFLASSLTFSGITKAEELSSYPICDQTRFAEIVTAERREYEESERFAARVAQAVDEVTSISCVVFVKSEQRFYQDDEVAAWAIPLDEAWRFEGNVNAFPLQFGQSLQGGSISEHGRLL